MNTGAINLGNPVSSSPLNRGLVGWWLALPSRMFGRNIMDLCTPQKHGAFVNDPAWQSARGRPGGWGSIALDGNDGYISVPTISLGTTAVTVAVWARPDDMTTDDYLSSHSGNAIALIKGYQDNNFNCLIGGNYPTGTAANSQIAGTALEWQHIAYSSNGSTCSGYLNGVKVISSIASRNCGANSTASIGAITTPGNWFGGALDDYRAWSRSLADDEVRAIYNDSRTGYPQTLNRLPRRSYAVSGGGGGGFQTAWAAGSNQVIQPWVAV